MKTLVAIPTLAESPYLPKLLDDLTGANVLVYDNRPRRGLWPSWLKVVHAPGRGIYEMWNDAWVKAAASGAANLVLLNDDIEIPPHFVERLTDALRDGDWWAVYPNYHRPLADDDPDDLTVTATNGTYRKRGMWGCAFALRAELLGDPLPPIDAQFRWWYGDDDLVEQIARHGGTIGRVEGLALEHHASTTGNRHPELGEVARMDGERYRAKYG